MAKLEQQLCRSRTNPMRQAFFGHCRVDAMREKTVASFMQRRQNRLHNPALLHTAQYGVLILD
jgi:hypothetical protein